MKPFLKKTAVVLALSFVSSTAFFGQSAQNVVYSRTTIQLTTSFVQMLQSMNTYMFDQNGAPLVNNTAEFAGASGALDPATGIGEISSVGGFYLNYAGHITKMQNFIVDTTNPQAPIISAVIINGGTMLGRIPLWNMILPANYSVPLQLQNGVVQYSNVTLSLTQAAANTFNAIYGGTYLGAGTVIANGSVYAVLR